MSAKIYWLNPEHSIIELAYDAPWTWDEAFRAEHQLNQILQHEDHAVGLIIDARQAHQVDINELSNFRRFDARIDPHVKVMVILTNDAFFRILANTVMTINQRLLRHTHDLFITDSHDHAVHFIQEHLMQEYSVG